MDKQEVIGLIIDLIEDNEFNTDVFSKDSFNKTIDRLKIELSISDDDIQSYYRNVLHIEN